MQGKSWIFVALVVVQAVIYGAGNVIMKVAYADITPLWCSAIRFGLAFAVFALLFGGRIVAELRRAGVRAWLPSGLCMAGSFIGCGVAVDMTTATNAAFFVALPMLFTPVLALVALKRAYRPSTMVLQAAVLVGLYLLCCNAGSLSIGAGEMVGLASSACFAGALVLGERGLGKVDAVAMSASQIGVTFLLSLVGALVFEPLPAVSSVAPISWVAIAFLALVGTCLAFFMQNTALTRVPSATVSVILCGEPVFTALFSALVLGEYLTGIGIAGAAIIVACTVCATLLDSRKGSTVEEDGNANEGARALAPSAQ